MNALQRFCKVRVPDFTPLGGNRPDAAVVGCAVMSLYSGRLMKGVIVAPDVLDTALAMLCAPCAVTLPCVQVPTSGETHQTSHIRIRVKAGWVVDSIMIGDTSTAHDFWACGGDLVCDQVVTSILAIKGIVWGPDSGSQFSCISGLEFVVVMAGRVARLGPFGHRGQQFAGQEGIQSMPITFLYPDSDAFNYYPYQDVTTSAPGRTLTTTAVGEGRAHRITSMRFETPLYGRVRFLGRPVLRQFKTESIQYNGCADGDEES